MDCSDLRLIIIKGITNLAVCIPAPKSPPHGCEGEIFGLGYGGPGGEAPGKILRLYWKFIIQLVSFQNVEKLRFEQNLQVT